MYESCTILLPSTQDFIRQPLNLKVRVKKNGFSVKFRAQHGEKYLSREKCRSPKEHCGEFFIREEHIFPTERISHANIHQVDVFRHEDDHIVTKNIETHTKDTDD